MRFYTFMQNNSGGFFYRNDDVDEVVIIEANSEEEAVAKFKVIAEDYSEYCDCCGERWDFYESDSVSDVPLIYGDAVGEAGWRAVVYYADGTKRFFDKQV